MKLLSNLIFNRPTTIQSFYLTEVFSGSLIRHDAFMAPTMFIYCCGTYLISIRTACDDIILGIWLMHHSITIPCDQNNINCINSKHQPIARVQCETPIQNANYCI